MTADGARPPGRHRRGAPATAVSRRAWDTEAWQAAAELDRAHPDWTVFYQSKLFSCAYGAHSRRFFALAAWPTAGPVTVSAARRALSPGGTATSPVPDRVTPTPYELRVLAALGSTYPGWRLRLVDVPGLPRWWAIRYGSLSDTQRAAGAREYTGRCTPAALGDALEAQAEILHRIRR